MSPRKVQPVPADIQIHRGTTIREAFLGEERTIGKPFTTEAYGQPIHGEIDVWWFYHRFGPEGSRMWYVKSKFVTVLKRKPPIKKKGHSTVFHIPKGVTEQEINLLRAVNPQRRKKFQEQKGPPDEEE